MNEDDCPCNTCPKRYECDGWDEAFCYALSIWQGTDDYLDPWDVERR